MICKKLEGCHSEQREESEVSSLLKTSVADKSEGLDPSQVQDDRVEIFVNV